MNDVETKKEKSCRNCGVVSDSLKRCGHCQLVFYCSQECQIRDWNQRHRSACKEVQRFIANSRAKSVKEGQEYEKNPLLQKLHAAEQLYYSPDEALASIDRFWREWGGNQDIIDLVLGIALKNDLLPLANYARDPKNPFRPRVMVAALFVSRSDFKETQLYKELYSFALENKFPTTCWSQAFVCLRRGNLAGYKHYLELSAAGGMFDAKEQLEELEQLFEI